MNPFTNPDNWEYIYDEGGDRFVWAYLLATKVTDEPWKNCAGVVGDEIPK